MPAPAPTPPLTPASPAPACPPARPLRWDIFCRVIDNFGDIGVCWRLAADLAAQGHAVRLWVDDARALAWMAPHGAPGVEVQRWPLEPEAQTDATRWPTPADVVLETFGCDLPEAFIARMAEAAQTGRAPVWINLEYLSAEDYVERSHRLASPQWRAPANGLVKWYFYPGFTPATGGLLREAHIPAPDLTPAQRHATLAELAGPDAVPRTDARTGQTERAVSLFAYPHAPLAELLAHLAPRTPADAPTLLLATPGAARDALAALPCPPGVRLHRLPWLTQAGYDRLLAACELNLVRGEDSFVRAQWAGQPFLWHIYFQDDGVHADKLEAFLTRHLHGSAPALAQRVRGWMRWWNGLAPAPGASAPGLAQDLAGWQAHARRWRAALLAQPGLSRQLLGFVAEKL